jgi:hypothetical protein
MEEGESLVRLVFAEALHAAGELERAKQAITAARESVMRRADGLSAEHRESFLHAIAENARILELARRWLGE